MPFCQEKSNPGKNSFTPPFSDFEKPGKSPMGLFRVLFIKSLKKASRPPTTPHHLDNSTLALASLFEILWSRLKVLEKIINQSLWYENISEFDQKALFEGNHFIPWKKRFAFSEIYKTLLGSANYAVLERKSDQFYAFSAKNDENLTYSCGMHRK